MDQMLEHSARCPDVSFFHDFHREIFCTFNCKFKHSRAASSSNDLNCQVSHGNGVETDTGNFQGL